MSILTLIDEFSDELYNCIENELKKEDVDIIKKSHGRSKDSPECCKNGSFIYFILNEENEIIYIGETAVSVKSRLFGDGSASHSKKKWFNQAKTIKYYKNDFMDDNSRKVLERVLIRRYKPIYND